MLIALLIIFIFFSTLLKLSFWRLWQIALWAGVLVAFLWGSYDFASEQSQTTLSQWLASPKILSDMAVLITIESAIGLLFAFVALRDYYQNRRSKTQRILLAFPGLLLFPCLIYVLAQAFFFFSGAGCATTRERSAFGSTPYGQHSYYPLRPYCHCKCPNHLCP